LSVFNKIIIIRKKIIAIENGKVVIEKIAEKKGQFNTKFAIGAFIFVSLLFIAIIFTP
jgi:hypothetical protein